MHGGGIYMMMAASFVYSQFSFLHESSSTWPSAALVRTSTGVAPNMTTHISLEYETQRLIIKLLMRASPYLMSELPVAILTLIGLLSSVNSWMSNQLVLLTEFFATPCEIYFEYGGNLWNLNFLSPFTLVLSDVLMQNFDVLPQLEASAPWFTANLARISNFVQMALLYVNRHFASSLELVATQIAIEVIGRWHNFVSFLVRWEISWKEWWS
jgi:hypothetical protein